MADEPMPSDATSSNYAQGNRTQNQDSRWNKILVWFSQLVVPLLLGSFLFSGILEGYKSSLGDKKDIIDSYYRPTRALHASCSTKNLELADQYGKLAGSYQLLFNEFKHAVTHPELAAKPGYEVILKTLAKNTEELANATKERANTVHQCRIDLYIKYEELALVTGTYKQFKRFASVRDKSLEKTEKQMKLKMEPYMATINSEDMMELLRKIVPVESDIPQSPQKYLDEIAVYANPIVTLHQLFQTTELEKFNTEQAFFKSASNLFAREISARQSKGFFSYLF
ncbi:hypothetical protein [Pseudomonas sp. UV AK001]|uniref:hypothetical protein n=1 Tax=Pseudomonas sp. UV AK001 TaxID=3384791 RepID=UPI0038D3535C